MWSVFRVKCFGRIIHNGQITRKMGSTTKKNHCSLVCVNANGLDKITLLKGAMGQNFLMNTLGKFKLTSLFPERYMSERTSALNL